MAFYSNVLGLTLSSRDAVARFHIDGVPVELAPPTDGAFLTGQGNARLCLAVDNLSQAVAVLQTWLRT